MRKTGTAAASCVLGLVMAGGAAGTTMERLSFGRMMEGADLVVEAQVTGSTVQHTDDGPYTFTTVRVRDIVSGQAGETIRIATPGGMAEAAGIPVMTSMVGAPVFIPDQVMMLWLMEDERHDAFAVVGLSQGMSQVVDGPRGAAVRLPGSGEVMMLDDAKRVVRQRKGE